MAPPELCEHVKARRPVRPVPRDEERARPVGGRPDVQRAPLSVEDVHEALDLRHVVPDGPFRGLGQLWRALVVGALDFQDPRRGKPFGSRRVLESQPGHEAVGRRAEPVVHHVVLLDLEHARLDLLAGQPFVRHQRACFALGAPPRRVVPLERLADPDLFLPERDPVAREKAQRLREGRRGQPTLAKALPQLRPLVALEVVDGMLCGRQRRLHRRLHKVGAKVDRALLDRRPRLSGGGIFAIVAVLAVGVIVDVFVLAFVFERALLPLLSSHPAVASRCVQPFQPLADRVDHLCPLGDLHAPVQLFQRAHQRRVRRFRRVRRVRRLPAVDPGTTELGTRQLLAHPRRKTVAVSTDEIHVAHVPFVLQRLSTLGDQRVGLGPVLGVEVLHQSPPGLLRVVMDRVSRHLPLVLDRRHVCCLCLRLLARARLRAATRVVAVRGRRRCADGVGARVGAGPGRPTPAGGDCGVRGARHRCRS